MSPRLAFFCACLAIVGGTGPDALAADRESVRQKWRTPFDLYLDPNEAYALKTANPDSVLLIDVRSQAEIQFTGFSGLADANIPLYSFDNSRWKEDKDARYGHYRWRRNADFVAAVERLLNDRGLDRESPIILMCRSGSRSPIAARLLHEAGFRRVYTQYQGFDGSKATEGPDKGRRVANGWRNAGLPWSYRLEASRMYFNFDPKQAPESQSVK